MFSLASVRYRNVLANNGGPIARVDVSEFPIYGRRVFQANARLAPGLIQKKPKYALYSDADGTGASTSPMIARFMAISESMERWAFHAKVHAADRELYGFDVDESSNGMAAFPEFFTTQARKHALLEAVERVSVIAWWEGAVEGDLRETEWPGVQALVIPSPIGFGVAVIAFKKSDYGFYSYGHGAGESFHSACERAVIELARNEFVLSLNYIFRGVEQRPAPSDLFERRCLFFSSEEGHSMFEERLHHRSHGTQFTSDIICDTEIPGPWSQYAKVWRVVIRPPTAEFLVNTERYFFW
ncbi:MAG TPA: hypothetical protein VKC60_15180 [Opitutaceae bacterium]|nr:hypothetical protein [Opitutaceae bacterium]